MGISCQKARAKTGVYVGASARLSPITSSCLLASSPAARMAIIFVARSSNSIDLLAAVARAATSPANIFKHAARGKGRTDCHRRMSFVFASCISSCAGATICCAQAANDVTAAGAASVLDLRYIRRRCSLEKAEDVSS